MANGEVPQSIFQQAAELPFGAPYILSVDESIAVEPGEACAVIDVNEFEEALRDPRLKAFTAEAIEYGARFFKEDTTL